jgi:hypothetical protein
MTFAPSFYDKQNRRHHRAGAGDFHDSAFFDREVASDLRSKRIAASARGVPYRIPFYPPEYTTYI